MEIKLEQGKWYKFGPTARIPFLVIKVVDGQCFHWRWMGDPEDRVQTMTREKMDPYEGKIVEYSWERDVFG